MHTYLQRKKKSSIKFSRKIKFFFVLEILVQVFLFVTKICDKNCSLRNSLGLFSFLSLRAERLADWSNQNSWFVFPQNIRTKLTFKFWIKQQLQIYSSYFFLSTTKLNKLWTLWVFIVFPINRFFFFAFSQWINSFSIFLCMKKGMCHKIRSQF